MRRTDAEFKAELLRRCGAYRRTRTQRRKKVLRAAVPLMAFLVCVSVLFASLASRVSIRNGASPGYTDASSKPKIVSVDVRWIPGALDQGSDAVDSPSATEKNGLRCTDPGKVAAIADCFASQTFTEAGFDNGEISGVTEKSLLFLLTDETGTAFSYQLYGDRYLLRGDGGWTKMRREDAERLKTLLAGMQAGR